MSTSLPVHTPSPSPAAVEPLEGRVLLSGGHFGHDHHLPLELAIAHMTHAPDNNVRGTVAFLQLGDDVLVKVNVRGLTPGEHGFHVHAGTVCDPDDPAGPFMSAGGHFNPTGEPHGSPDSPDHHVGDLGNIVADSKGRARALFLVHDVDLTGDQGIEGHALIIHANPDDLETQPTGNSGARIACGIIEPVGKGNDGHDNDDDGHDDHPHPNAPPPFSVKLIRSILRELF